MKPRTRHAVLMAVLLIFFCTAASGTFTQAFGQEPGSIPSVEQSIDLKVEQAVALALENSHQLRYLESNVEIQAGRLWSAGWIDNPEIRVRDLTTSTSNQRNDELGIGIRWRPPGLGELSEDKQQEQVRFWEEKVTELRERQWHASRVRRACADVIMYRELLRIAKVRVDNEVKRISQIEAMLNLGRRSIVYFTKAKMTVAITKNEYTQIRQSLHEEERRLARLTGVSDKINIVDEPIPTVEQDMSQLIPIVFANRPEVKLVEERKKLAVKQYNHERLQLVPWFSFLEVSHHTESMADDWQELMFGVDIPLFNWNIGNIRATKLGIARKNNQTLAIQERIEDEVRDRLAIYNDALLAWNLAKRDGEEMTRDASRVIDHAIAHHTVPADEILELERTIMDTKVIQIEKRRELAHALYDLWFVLGVQTPAQLIPKKTDDGN